MPGLNETYPPLNRVLVKAMGFNVTKLSKKTFKSVNAAFENVITHGFLFFNRLQLFHFYFIDDIGCNAQSLLSPILNCIAEMNAPV